MAVCFLDCALVDRSVAIAIADRDAIHASNLFKCGVDVRNVRL